MAASAESSLKTSEKIENLIKFVESLKSHDSSGKEDEKKQEEDGSVKLERPGDRFYLTTAINYTNGRPHIGHAYEAVVSDIVCRYHRVYGREVFFLTGTDEHGQKIADTALKANLTPKELCDKNVKIFQELNRLLDISNDRYIRTTDEDHLVFAKQLFQKAHENGDIYLHNYEGWYNVKEEQYVTDHDAQMHGFQDPVTKAPYEKRKEEAYFFKMGKYQARLIKFMEDNPTCIHPQSAYNNIYTRLTSNELRDLCVSRAKTRLEWGVELPNDKSHVMYVWFDALSNYLTGIDYFGDQGRKSKESGIDLKLYWPVDAHVIGRDIAWFHCVIWPCILMSTGIPLYKRVVCHGFVTDESGLKMSKSLKNVVDPFTDVLSKYSSDSIRYFIASNGVFGDDMRWSDKGLKEMHQAHLTHNFGNLVNRTIKLTEKYLKGRIPAEIPESDRISIFGLKELKELIEDHFASFELQEAAHAIMNRLRMCNDWLYKAEPWKEKDLQKRTRVLRTMLDEIYVLAHFMAPFTPNASAKTFKQLNTPMRAIRELREDFRGHLKEGTVVATQGEVLFKQFETRYQKKVRTENRPDIARVDFRIGMIREVQPHPSAEALFVEKIDLGEPTGPRTIVSGLVGKYTESELVGKRVIVFANLKASKFRGILSQGMVMCACNDDKSIVKILEPPSDAEIGSRLNWSESDLVQWKADDSIKIGKKKSSFWETDIAPNLKTNGQGQMCLNGKTFVTKRGKFIVADLTNALIS